MTLPLAHFALLYFSDWVRVELSDNCSDTIAHEEVHMTKPCHHTHYAIIEKYNYIKPWKERFLSFAEMDIPRKQNTTPWLNNKVNTWKIWHDSHM